MLASVIVLLPPTLVPPAMPTMTGGTGAAVSMVTAIGIRDGADVAVAGRSPWR